MQNIFKIYLFIAFILIESITQTPQYPNNQKKKILRNAEEITKIRIQFCQSWSFVGYFQEVKRQLEYRYQDVEVIPEQYPLKNPRKAIYNIMITLEVIFISIILLSDFIIPKIENYLVPDLIILINENKLAKIALIFFICQYLGQIISNAGAFEVFCDDKLIWSTIDHKGIPPNLSTIVKLVKQLQKNWRYSNKNCFNFLFLSEDIYLNVL